MMARSLVVIAATAAAMGNEPLPTLYYINLDRRPDRRAFMEAELIRENAADVFNVTRFPAVDGAVEVGGNGGEITR